MKKTFGLVPIIKITLTSRLTWVNLFTSLSLMSRMLTMVYLMIGKIDFIDFILKMLSYISVNFFDLASFCLCRATKDLKIDVSLCSYKWTTVRNVTLEEVFSLSCDQVQMVNIDVDIIGRYVKVISVNYYHHYSAALTHFGVQYDMPNEEDIPQHQCMSEITFFIPKLI